jgi:thiol-disulfide isomerase/thioredoxin
MRTTFLCAVTASLLLLAAGPGLAQDAATNAKLVKYAELADMVEKNKGKVIVVDLWTTACKPCIEKFPKLVELQTKYGKDKLLVMTVNIDSSINDPDDRPVILGAIQNVLGGKNPSKTKVTLTNLILDEPQELVLKKFHFDGAVPCMFVFTREGKWWQFRVEEGQPDIFERVVQRVEAELK